MYHGSVPEVDPTDPQSILAKLARVEAELAAVKAELARKNEIIAALQHRLFGSSSERMDPAQLQLDFDAIVMGLSAPPAQDDEQATTPSAPADAGPKSARSRRKKTDIFPENLKVVIDQVIVPDVVAANPDDWKEIGEEYHDELEVTRAQLFWRRTVSKKFASKGDRTQPPVIAPAPAPSLPGTLCGPSLAAQIVVDKFCDHLPHYRQSARLFRLHGVHIGRQTLNAWSHAVAEHLSPIAEAIKEELFHAVCLQVDETPIKYLSPGLGQAQNGYLWTYLDPQTGTVYYDWQTGRSLDCLTDIIKIDEATGLTYFQGIIQCDGYSVYLALAKRYSSITVAGCLAHIRRKFFDARKQAPEVVLPILYEIQQLYQIERQLRNSKAPPICRELVRQARSRPIAEELYKIILEQKSNHLAKSKLGEAIEYALGQWDKFTIYLTNGEVEIDNNLVENAIRPTRLGAKNYLFFGSAEAGVHNALLYTLMANCKAQGLDPERYLAEVIKRLPAEPTPEQAAALTPARIAAEQAKSETPARKVEIGVAVGTFA